MNRKYFYLLEQMSRLNLYRRNEGCKCEDCQNEDCEDLEEDKEVITAQPRGVKVQKIIVDDGCDNKDK